MWKLSALLSPFSCALVFCLANAWKPAVIDDLAYIWYARQIVETPGQPFGPPPDGFKVIWYDKSQPAFTLLTPLVVPYWLAAGMASFGENLVLLKLWLFPFCLLFVSSLSALLKRYAPGYDRPFLAMTVLSPLFLPSLNVMVDVPAVALGLTAIAVFHRALDPPRTSWGLVIAAGLISGLAMQTKYTGATSCAVILLYASLNRRWAAGLISALVASSVFIGWETYLFLEYGRSHFLLQLENRRTDVVLLLPLFGILGAVAAINIPLILAGLRCPRWVVLTAVCYLAAGFVLMTAVPGRWATFHGDARDWRNELSICTIFIGCNGALLGLLVPAAAAYLGFRGWSRGKIRLRWNAVSWFLIGWLVVETASYFVLSPFPAARRVMGVTIASAMLVGRLVSLTCRCADIPQVAFSALRPGRRRLIVATAAFGVGLGALFGFTDYRDGLVEKEAMLQSIAFIRAQPGGDRPIWFCGHWGFQYYGEREGLRTVYPGESELEQGDWLIYPDMSLRPYGQTIELDPDTVEPAAFIERHECWPLRTISDFYDGSPPIRRHDGPRLRLTIYRVTNKFLTAPAKSD